MCERSFKWWKKLFLHLFSGLICNSYILYKKSVEKPVSHYQFRLEIVKALILASPGNVGPSSSGRKLSEVPERLNKNFNHFPKYCEARAGAKRQRPLRDCTACNVPKAERQGAKRKQTSFECMHCKVPLCVPDCFLYYHTKVNFKQFLWI